MDHLLNIRHASLFTGIGGFDLAAHWMGWRNVFQVEKDPACHAWLEEHFPEADRHHDIHDFTGETAAQYANSIDVLSGGFPCQPYSNAGKRRGKADDRHLWPEMLRVIREIRPRWVVGENVRGLVNWEGGMVVEEVLADLEALGYRTAPPFIIPACGKDAPHRRDRIWIVAHADGTGGSGEHVRGNGGQAATLRRHAPRDVPRQCAIAWPASDTDELACGQGGAEHAGQFGNAGTASVSREILAADALGVGSGEQADETQPVATGGRARPEPSRDGGGWPIAGAERRRWGWEAASHPHREHGEGNGAAGEPLARSAGGAGPSRRDLARTDWKEFPTVSPVCARNDGVSSRLVRYTDGTDSRFNEAQAQGRLRKEALKGGGNAIVPHIALAIFQAIAETERATAAGA